MVTFTDHHADALSLSITVIRCMHLWYSGIFPPQEPHLWAKF